MRIRFWGTRGTRPTPGRRTLRYGGNTACVEVRDSNDELLIIDSGSGIAELGAQLARNGPLAITMLVTHTHWDHIQGFPFFGPAFVPGTRLRVVGPAGSIKSLKAAFSDQMDPAYFPLRMDQMPADFEFIEVSAGQVFYVGGMRVVPHEMNHPIVTHGYRIEESGASFAFATDNELALPPHEWSAAAHLGGAFDAVAGWCRGVQLLAHDAQYSDAEYPQHVGWGHSTFDDALELATQAGVERLAFYHHDPLHSDDEIDQLAGEAIERRRELGSEPPPAFPASEDVEIELRPASEVTGAV